MGSIHQIGDEYYVEFMARGLKYQQKAGKDLKKAEELLRQIEEKIARGELMTITREIGRDVFFAEFIKWAQEQYHPQTVRRLTLAIAHFDRFLNENLPDVKKLSQVTPRVIEEYKTAHIQQRSQGKELNPKIINLTLLLIREVLEYGIKTGYINDNPTLHIKLLDVPSPQAPLPISPDTFAKIIEGVPEHIKQVLVFLRNTGIRLRELEGLTWLNVDFNRNVIFVKFRDVPLNAQALTVLKSLYNVIDHKEFIFKDEEGQPLSSEIVVRFEKASRKAGLASANISILRHSFACELLQMRLSFLTAGKILGIHDPARLMTYASCIPVSREDIHKGVYGA